MQRLWIHRSVAPSIFAIAALTASCGSSSSDETTAASNPTGGTCVVSPGESGSWEITALDEASSWTQVCQDGGELVSGGKYFRIEGLQLAEGEELRLMPFSNGQDNSFRISFSSSTVSTDFAPNTGKDAETFNLDLTSPRTICVEIHGFSSETHIWAYEKGTDAATCSSEDRTTPAANWQVDTPASDRIGGSFLGYTVSSGVQFERIVVTNRASGQEAGSPAE